MAILHFNGFDNLPATVDLSFAYPNYAISGSSQLSTTTSPLGGLELSSGVGGSIIRYDLGSNFTTLIIGCRVKVLQVNLLRSFFVFKDSDLVDQCGLGINASGKLIFFRGTTSTIIDTGATTFIVGNYYYIELKVTFNSSTGSYEAKIDGVTEFSGSGVDTAATANDNARYPTWNIGTSSTPMSKLDDIYISDISGSAPGNDFLGKVRVETLAVSSDDSVQWTPLSSTNASNVDDISSDDDTSYNSDSTSGHIDLFNHAALSVVPVDIFGVAVVTKIRGTDVNRLTYRTKLKIGSTVSDGVDAKTQSTSYTYSRDQYLLNPDTSAKWDKSSVDACKIGYEHR